MKSFLPLIKAPKEFHTLLSPMHAYQQTYPIHSTVSSLSMLIFIWNGIFYSLINVLDHHDVIADVIIQTIAFCAVSPNKLLLHKKIFIVTSAVA